MTSKKRALDGIDEDIKDHIERQTQENIERGMAPDEARRRALLGFGNVALVKEDARAVWVSRRIDETRQDVGYALRALRRNRGATLLGILVMALAIGANTAVFSVVHAVVLSPLPYSNADRIVTLSYLSTSASASGNGEGKCPSRTFSTGRLKARHSIRWRTTRQGARRSWLAPRPSMPSSRP